MLAKLWKKVLLAVCIVACIFNIMTKLVNRKSLEVNLKSANDGNTVFDLTRKDSTGIIDNTVNDTQMQNQNEQASMEENSNSQEEVINTESNNTEVEQDENVENNKTENKSSSGVKYKDITFVELF